MNPNIRRSSAAEEAGRTVKISLEGSPEEVDRMLQRLAGSAVEATSREPAQLLLTRDMVMQRTGWGHNRITGLVQAGQLTNHGSGRKLLINPLELEELIKRAR
ncbi:MAG: hypothetical protein JWO59_688 [Chloroflexi bacterium]|nr:hypothetical protein [Chloroflexota bacterium]